MSKLISTLEQLQQIRHRAVDDLSLKLASQQQICQRYEKNIGALTSLAQEIAQTSETCAALMVNQASYRRNIQRVIDWQKQEQALANLEARELQKSLLAEARREKSLTQVLEARRSEHRQENARREQKLTDAISTQSWLRQQLLRQR
ncbi:flagellar export protein FliJ [Pluralibacter gergoviae]|uniref:flagellar export protein FliJ n=1 Tax=Pluralibacter gergoviae TaxID=61647 RepID=UPI003EE42171